MASTVAPRFVGTPVWRTSLLEWALLAVVIAGTVFFLWREARAVQALAERSTVQSTLGALRTALALEQLASHSSGKPLASGMRNPFLALERVPTNYAGAIDRVNALQLAPGQWVFDGACGCIAYRPLFPQWLDGMGEVQMLWFQLQQVASVTLINAKEAYVWQGLQIQ